MRSTIAESAAALRRQETTAQDLVRTALHRIDEANDRLNAFVLVDRDGALAAARTADAELAAGLDRGPLHGLPVSVKDIIDVAGLPTTCGSATSFGTAAAEHDAAIVTRLREAGAVLVGKNTLHEFAYGITGDRSAHGASRNPRDPDRMSGGSSGGSAAAVAAGLVVLALGTDTAGSVRVPAALCGIVGLRPAFDALPCDGVYPLAPSFDTVGLLTAGADDGAIAYAALTDANAGGAGRSEPSVGWIRPDALAVTDERVTAAVRGRLERAGLAPVDAPPPAQADDLALADVFAILQRGEAYRSHAHHLDADADAIDPEILARLRAGRTVAPEELARAEAARMAFSAQVAALLETFDVLALPTTSIVAPLIGERTVRVNGSDLDVRRGLLGLTSPWSLVGVPVLSVPAGTVDGLPVGAQVITAPGRERLLFDIGQRLEISPDGEENA